MADRTPRARAPRKAVAPRKASTRAKPDAFALLTAQTQSWIKKKKWTAPTDIQQAAIPVVHQIISEGLSRDCIISAPTATGKTEAVFLPLASILDAGGDAPSPGAAVLYVCPLTALIDQQAKRLDRLFDPERFPIVPWHRSSLLARPSCNSRRIRAGS
jgi:ATP-dependent helicase Lhr and Lhr-like helicase